MTKDEPEIDYVLYAAIAFPSDKLTIGALRKAHPDDFDLERADFLLPEREAGTAAEAASNVLFFERLLARYAYEQARGRLSHEFLHNPGPDSVGHARTQLLELYTRYGLASGPEHARQLIRDFQDQAASQARPGREGKRGRQ